MSQPVGGTPRRPLRGSIKKPIVSLQPMKKSCNFTNKNSTYEQEEKGLCNAAAGKADVCAWCPFCRTYSCATCLGKLTSKIDKYSEEQCRSRKLFRVACGAVDAMLKVQRHACKNVDARLCV